MTTTRKPTYRDIVEATSRAIDEIIADINDGTLPFDVNGWSVLDDYVDANTYGGLCDEGELDWGYDSELGDASMDPGYQMQDAVHNWLTARAQRLGITEHVYDPTFGSGLRSAHATRTDEI